MSGADELAVAAAQSLRALECDTASQDTADDPSGRGAERPSKSSRHTVYNTAGGPMSGAAAAACSGGGVDTSASRHIQTEQRRRNRINEGFSALRDLIPSKDKTDKATFLMQVVDYVRQLQGVLHQLMESGAVNKLPEDLQWSIRLLVPRRSGAAAPTDAAASAAVRPSAAVPAAVPEALPAASASAAAAPSACSAPAMVQPGGLGLGNLLAQQAAMAQLHLLQQLVAQTSVGLPAQSQPALPLPVAMPIGSAGMLLAPDVMAVLAQQLQALPGVVPASEPRADSTYAPASAPAPATCAVPSCAAADMQEGASAESSSSQEEGGARGGAPKPARKGAKVRRHTTAARFTRPPSSPGDAPGVENLAGRPANGDQG